MKIIIGLIILFLLIRYAGALRLTILLLYAFIIPTICADWYYEHYALANGIWYGLIVLVALSWIIIAIRRLLN